MNVDVALIREITARLRETPHVQKAVLFGSRARGDTGEKSDYDIAVYGTLSKTDRAQLRYAFDEELPTLHKIDLIFMQEQPESPFRASIEREGVVIYAEDRK